MKDAPTIADVLHPPCAILAIDPGEKSGAALFVRGLLRDSRQVKGAQERQKAVERALRSASSEGLPLLVVRERWTAGGAMVPKVAMGLGAAWGRWAEHLETAGIGKTRIATITPQKWRSLTIGGPQRSREQWKADAILFAREHGGFDPADTIGPDEAAAVCIGFAWMRVPREVGRYIQLAERARKLTRTDVTEETNEGMADAPSK